MMVGAEAGQVLAGAHVAVFGLGGVGGSACEALARCGVGKLSIIDGDVVARSNINRQIIAFNSTVGKSKTDIMEARIKDINPNCRVVNYCKFFKLADIDSFDFAGVDYVVDAIDTITDKLDLIEHLKKNGIRIVSAMGAGNKLDPTAFRVADVYKTQMCPLAKVMRRELKKRNIDSLKVVYSEEKPVIINKHEEQSKSEPMENETPQSVQNTTHRKDTPGSVAFVPPVMGYVLASVVIKDLLGI